VRYKRYPNYKNSGIEWIGEIPEGWKLKKGKWLLKNSEERNAKNLTVLSATQSRGVIPKIEVEGIVQHKVDTNFTMFKRVRQKDFVISLRSFQGGFELSQYEGVITPAYTVLRPAKEVFSHYFKYLLKEQGFISRINSLTVGIREGKSIRYEDFAQMLLPLPNASVQQSIANFLDRKVSQIDSLIADQQKLIGLFEEKRSALITHAVTKGLDPNVRMKDSGVEWLGEIPYRWKVRKFKWLVDVQEGPGIMASDFKDEGVPLLRIRNLTPGVTDIEGCNYLDPEKVTRQWKQFRLEEEDLLISGSASTGQVSFVSKEARGAIAYTGIFRIRPMLNNLEKKYLAYYVSSDYFLQQVNSLSTGVGIRHYGPTHLRVVVFPLPPIEEQRAICSKLDSLLTRIDQLISRAVFLTELLTEYRTALISAAVTGKIDVRGEVS
jgi:type I restriction enzyme S subunit